MEVNNIIANKVATEVRLVFDEKSPRFQKEIVKGIIKPFLTDFLPADNH